MGGFSSCSHPKLEGAPYATAAIPLAHYSHNKPQKTHLSHTHNHRESFRKKSGRNRQAQKKTEMMFSFPVSFVLIALGVVRPSLYKLIELSHPVNHLFAASFEKFHRSHRCHSEPLPHALVRRRLVPGEPETHLYGRPLALRQSRQGPLHTLPVHPLPDILRQQMEYIHNPVVILRHSSTPLVCHSRMLVSGIHFRKQSIKNPLSLRGCTAPAAISLFNPSSLLFVILNLFQDLAFNPVISTPGRNLSFPFSLPPPRGKVRMGVTLITFLPLHIPNAYTHKQYAI